MPLSLTETMQRTPAMKPMPTMTLPPGSDFSSSLVS